MPERRPPRSVSVIMPVLDEEEHIGDALAGLARQDYSGEWEVVVADNGCTDRSIEIVESWRERLPGLRVVDASGQRGEAHARNVAADAARGEFLASCDADNMPSPGWLRALAEAAAGADLVGAGDDRRLLNRGLPDDWPPAQGRRLRGQDGFLNAGGGKLGVWTEIARTIRWDESLPSGPDVDFSWRAHLAGMTLVRVPEAVMHRRLRRRLPAVARQAFRSGYVVPTLRARYRSSGLQIGPDSVRSRWARLLRELARAPTSRAARARLAWDFSFALGRLLGSWRARGPAARTPAVAETKGPTTA